MFIRPEIETSEEIRTEPVATDNRIKLLLAKRRSPIQVVDDLKSLMANIDPNRS